MSTTAATGYRHPRRELPPLSGARRNDQAGPCDRCGLCAGVHRWVPAPETFGRGYGALRLCGGCVEALRSFLGQGRNPSKLAKIRRGRA